MKFMSSSSKTEAQALMLQRFEKLTGLFSGEDEHVHLHGRPTGGTKQSEQCVWSSARLAKLGKRVQFPWAQLLRVSSSDAKALSGENRKTVVKKIFKLENAALKLIARH